MVYFKRNCGKASLSCLSFQGTPSLTINANRFLLKLKSNQIAALADGGGGITTWDFSSESLVQTDEWSILTSTSAGPKTMVADATRNQIHVSAELAEELQDIPNRLSAPAVLRPLNNVACACARVSKYLAQARSLS